MCVCQLSHQMLDLAERNLIQKAWEQLVSETGPPNPDRGSLEEVHVMRGHFNRSLLGGRFPQALEVRNAARASFFLCAPRLRNKPRLTRER